MNILEALQPSEFVATRTEFSKDLIYPACFEYLRIIEVSIVHNAAMIIINKFVAKEHGVNDVHVNILVK